MKDRENNSEERQNKKTARRLPLLLLFLICIVLTACEAAPDLVVPTGSPTSERLFVATPGAAFTSSPGSFVTGTVSPTSSPASLSTNTLPAEISREDFAGPVEDSEIEIPDPVAPIDFPSDTVNILLLGTDRRPTWKWYQTDAIMILSLDLDTHKATIISIPRDLYVYIPGWKVNRINTAEYRGGFEMIANTILYNLGIPIHHWIRVDYWGFSDAIDVLGGIEVHVNRRLKSMCEGIPYEYETGDEVHMDGFAAMCYVRMRMNSSDFDRLRRQEEVTRAIFDKVISIDGLLKFPQLYETFRQFAESDLSLAEILPLLPLATKLTLDPSQIRFYRIDYSMVEGFRTPESGQLVLLPKNVLIREMLELAFGVS